MVINTDGAATILPLSLSSWFYDFSNFRFNNMYEYYFPMTSQVVECKVWEIMLTIFCSLWQLPIRFKQVIFNYRLTFVERATRRLKYIRPAGTQKCAEVADPTAYCQMSYWNPLLNNMFLSKSSQWSCLHCFEIYIPNASLLIVTS